MHGLSPYEIAGVVPEHQILPQQLWVSKKNRTACLFCMKTFNLLRHRHHCRTCGDLFCKDCVVYCKSGDASVKVCCLCVPTVDPMASSPPLKPEHLHRTQSFHGIKLLDTRRCAEYSTPKASSTTLTRSLSQSPSAMAQVRPSPSRMEETLAMLLVETTNTQAQLVVQNGHATKVLGSHSHKINELNQAIARMEAQLWTEPRDLPCS
ncbi:Aste57867_10063 [Aphanomyces stellatus]|uniref:Aste57867_10063 protein n=1 Tax=Aphanomyces stellatus TaxID=120398 RepID=A0A485KPE6_9STRA|nr:hypothetical protein As57867_010024 [Aphanomyces stellatus]VFT86939.1 Aste57867_10063 [Aphanomyces stellatus]